MSKRKKLSKEADRLFDLFLFELFHIDAVRLSMYSSDLCESGEERQEVEKHLNSCQRCRDRLSSMEEIYGPHVTLDQLALFVHKALQPEEMEQVQDHLSCCKKCSKGEGIIREESIPSTEEEIQHLLEMARQVRDMRSGPDPEDV